MRFETFALRKYIWWCEENINSEHWEYIDRGDYYKIYIMHGIDATAFKLTFGL